MAVATGGRIEKRQEDLTVKQAAHILIVDDEWEIDDSVSHCLRKNGMRITVVDDGRKMRSFIQNTQVDLIVLDLMITGDDGMLLCRELHTGKHRATPILILTARNDETDRILALEMCADDYLTKPVAGRELMARINAVLRRTRMLPPSRSVTESPRILSFGTWRLDTTARHLLDEKETLVDLSEAEYRLLRVFLDHPHQVLSRCELLTLTQGLGTDLFDRSIDLLVRRLRQRLADNWQDPTYIKTVRNEGYVFSCSVETLAHSHDGASSRLVEAE